MKLKMTNLKVFAEVKKNLYNFFIQENACCRYLAVCLHKNEKSIFTLLLKIFVYFILMMGGAGLGPPNRYRRRG